MAMQVADTGGVTLTLAPPARCTLSGLRGAHRRPAGRRAPDHAGGSCSARASASSACATSCWRCTKPWSTPCQYGEGRVEVEIEVSAGRVIATVRDHGRRLRPFAARGALPRHGGARPRAVPRLSPDGRSRSHRRSAPRTADGAQHLGGGRDAYTALRLLPRRRRRRAVGVRRHLRQAGAGMPRLPGQVPPPSVPRRGPGPACLPGPPGLRGVRRNVSRCADTEPAVLWVSDRRRGIVASCNACRLENGWRTLLTVTPDEAGAASATGSSPSERPASRAVG